MPGFQVSTCFTEMGEKRRHDWHEYASSAPGHKLKAFEVLMSPLGQTLESGFSIVKVLSVLEVCPLGVQVFNSNDLPAYLCRQTSTTNFMGGHVENPQAGNDGMCF